MHLHIAHKYRVYFIALNLSYALTCYVYKTIFFPEATLRSKAVLLCKSQKYNNDFSSKS